MTTTLDRHYIAMCLELAATSSDPNTRVGAVIVRHHPMPIGDIEIGRGWNRFPAGVAATAERLADRETKLSLTVHAELAALLNAATRGRSPELATMYLAATDDTGAVWGGPPCTGCAIHLIEAGIAEVVAPPYKAGPSNWRASVERARALLAEAGVRFREVEWTTE